uniref:Cilia- and flagella-associated protein 53 n=1 Tax=Zooxanthella nutricula TaxID=1333877 RepID=A0A7S2IZ40_9DINO
MATIPSHLRADRLIIKRQQQEIIHEGMMAGQHDQFKVAQKGMWENRMVDVIRGNRVKSKAQAIDNQHKASLQARRIKLAEKLHAEQKAYEKEMVDRDETPQQRMDKMAVRAYELKKRREEERKAVVQEKLYQQWRSGIDDLRTSDSKIVELKVIAERDFQLDEKAAIMAEEKAHDDFYSRLWHEGYLAKIEREEREKELKRERNDQQTRTLAVQLEMKKEKVQAEEEQEAAEVGEMKKLWAAQAAEEKEAIIRERVLAKEERKKADEYMEIQQAQKAEEDRLDKEFDKNFINGVLERERIMAEREEAEKTKAKKKAIEFTEALKLEMARKAESEEELIKLQKEESERQWAKRYAAWEKEELARRALMEEVYHDRAEQVRLKSDVREKLKEEQAKERDMVESEIKRLEAIEQERVEGEGLVQKRHQEELFRQMDFHQVQRHRQLQQHAIEQRQSLIAEEKIRRAVAQEKNKAGHIMREVQERRAAKSAAAGPGAGPVAPWDK